MSEAELNDMIREEAMSDLMAEVMRDPNTIERIALENRTLAEKIIDCLRKMVDEIKAAFSSLGNVADPEVRALVKNFDLISEIYQEVLVGSEGGFEGRTITKNEKQNKFSVNSLNNDARSDMIDGSVETETPIEDDSEILWLPKREYAMVSKAIMAKNAGLQESELKPIDYVYAADEMYIYKNKSFGEFTISKKLSTTKDIDEIKYVREMIDNGTHTDRQGFDKWTADIRGRRTSDTWDTGRTKNAGTERTDDRLYDEQQRSDAIGYSARIIENNQNKKISNEYAKAGTSKIQNSVVRRRDKAQEAINKYRESGDVRDLPPNSWASGYARDAKGKVIHIENQLAEAEYNAKYNAETQEDNAALTELIKKLEQKHDEALKELGVAEDLRDTIKSATLRDLGLSEIAGELHDTDKGLDIAKNGNRWKITKEAVIEYLKGL